MNRPLLDRSAAVAAMAQQGASGKAPSSSLMMTIPTAAAAAAAGEPVDTSKRSSGGSLDDFGRLKSSLPTLKEGATSRPTSKDGKDGKNDHEHNCAHNPPNHNNNKSSSPLAFRLGDETSRRIDQVLLLRPSSAAPDAACTSPPCCATTAATATATATATAERPSVQIQKHVYRRAAERLGLRIRKTKKNIATTCTTPPKESAMVKKRQATDVDTDTDNQQHATMQNLHPIKKKRKTVTFRPTATLSTIERISPSESKAMHRTSEEIRQDRDRTLQNARDLRNLFQLYGDEDVGTIRSLAQCLQIDTYVRGVEPYLSQEVYEGRRRAALQVVDTVLKTQALHRQRMAEDAASRQQGGQQPGPATFVDAMTNGIALASASLSRGAVVDAVNRGASDEANAMDVFLQE